MKFNINRYSATKFLDKDLAREIRSVNRKLKIIRAIYEDFTPDVDAYIGKTLSMKSIKQQAKAKIEIINDTLKATQGRNINKRELSYILNRVADNELKSQIQDVGNYSGYNPKIYKSFKNDEAKDYKSNNEGGKLRNINKKNVENTVKDIVRRSKVSSKYDSEKTSADIYKTTGKYKKLTREDYIRFYEKNGTQLRDEASLVASNPEEYGTEIFDDLFVDFE